MKLKTGSQLWEINEMENWLLEKINKIDKILGRLRKRTEHWYQRWNRRHNKFPDIKRAIKEYNEQLCIHKSGSLDKMGQTHPRRYRHSEWAYI
jgi:hypothetical protein